MRAFQTSTFLACFILSAKFIDFANSPAGINSAIDVAYLGTHGVLVFFSVFRFRILGGVDRDEDEDDENKFPTTVSGESVSVCDDVDWESSGSRTSS